MPRRVLCLDVVNDPRQEVKIEGEACGPKNAERLAGEGPLRPGHSDLCSEARFTFMPTGVRKSLALIFIYMTTIETSLGRREMQIGFVGLGKMGRPMAIRVKTAVHDLWGRHIVEETLL